MIIIDHISKKYLGSYVLRDISLTFKPRETVAIIGASGSGKSTLLRCLNYLEKPTSGKVEIDGILLTLKNRHKLCLKLGMVFQNFNLFPHFNVIENLTYAPLKILKNLSPLEINNKAKNLLEQFEMQGKESLLIQDLSGGQKQRIAIARALMMDPEYILFDEPTSALDPERVKQVIEIFQQLKATKTLIIVTHHLQFAKAIADRIIFLDQGIILCDQDKNDFFDKPRSHRVKLFLQNTSYLI